MAIFLRSASSSHRRRKPAADIAHSKSLPINPLYLRHSHIHPCLRHSHTRLYPLREAARGTRRRARWHSNNSTDSARCRRRQDRADRDDARGGRRVGPALHSVVALLPRRRPRLRHLGRRLSVSMTRR